jgi:hypothetical protein
MCYRLVFLVLVPLLTAASLFHVLPTTAPGAPQSLGGDDHHYSLQLSSDTWQLALPTVGRTGVQELLFQATQLGVRASNLASELRSNSPKLNPRGANGISPYTNDGSTTPHSPPSPALAAAVEPTQVPSLSVSKTGFVTVFDRFESLNRTTTISTCVDNDVRSNANA